jgi:hypothetical protein
MYNSNAQWSGWNNMAYDPGTQGHGAYSSSGQTFGSWPQSFGAATLNSADFSLYVSGN